jgi:methionyl-tRNA synthetase
MYATMATIDQLKAIDITLGKILSVERVPETDKLLRLEVDFAEETPRQVVSGIAEYLEDPQVLVGRTVPFATNLEPRTIRGLESQAMIVAASTEDGVFSVLEPTLADIPAGTKLN